MTLHPCFQPASLTPHPTPLQAWRWRAGLEVEESGDSIEELSGGRSSGPDQQQHGRAIQPPKLPRSTGEADGCDADEFIQEAERILRNYRMGDGTAVE